MKWVPTVLLMLACAQEMGQRSKLLAWHKQQQQSVGWRLCLSVLTLHTRTELNVKNEGINKLSPSRGREGEPWGWECLCAEEEGGGGGLSQERREGVSGMQLPEEEGLAWSPVGVEWPS